jgi:hypothetical protein
MKTESHDVKETIISVQLPCDHRGNPMDFIVGRNGVTRIEACEKNGEYCMIPYVRVWKGDRCVAEFSQHKASYICFQDG